ncbi:hypothetical protein AVEN_172389-1, partial [Araneus ventricosus]
IVAGSKIRTIGWMVEHLLAEMQQQLLRSQRRMRSNVVVEQFQRLPSVSAPEKAPVKQHFPNDDDVQTEGCHKLAPFSDGESLRHRCTN